MGPTSNGSTLWPVGGRLNDIWGLLQHRCDGQAPVVSLSLSTFASSPMLMGSFDSRAPCASNEPGHVGGRFLGEEPGLSADVTLHDISLDILSTGSCVRSNSFYSLTFSTVADEFLDLCASVDMRVAPGRAQEATHRLAAYDAWPAAGDAENAQPAWQPIGRVESSNVLDLSAAWLEKIRQRFASCTCVYWGDRFAGFWGIVFLLLLLLLVGTSVAHGELGGFGLFLFRSIVALSHCVGSHSARFLSSVFGPLGAFCSSGFSFSWSAMWLTFSILLAPADAVCKVCHGFYTGCTGGDDERTCTGMATVQANIGAVAAAGAAAITLVGLFKPRVLRVFNTQVLTALKQYATAPVSGTPFTFEGREWTDVVASVISGKCHKSEAQLFFSQEIHRVSQLGDEGQRAAQLASLEAQFKLLGGIEERASTSTSATATTGALIFVLGKCSEVVLAKDGKTSLSEKEKGSLNSKIYTPTTAEEFFEILSLFQAMMVQLGLAPLMVIFDFVQNTVWLPLRQPNCNWMLAHELLVAYLDRVDQSVDRSLNLTNVYQREGVDAMRNEAMAAARARFGSKFNDIFRSTEGVRAPEGAKPFNGKFSANSRMPCEAFNRGVEHNPRHLHPDGTCKFKHGCSKWIKLADGSIGHCLRDHKIGDCDRTPAECSPVGPTKK